MPDTDRLALADELKRLRDIAAEKYAPAPLRGGIFSQPGNEIRCMRRDFTAGWEAALRAMPTPAGEDAESDAEVVRAILTAAYKVRQQALGATPGPASREETK